MNGTYEDGSTYEDGAYQDDPREPPVRGAWPDGRHWGVDAHGRSTWQRGRILGLCAVLLGLLPVFHRVVPDARGLGSLLETFLPWFGLLILPLLLLARRRRSALVLLALVVPIGAWAGLIGGAFLGGPGSGPYDFSVVQHNIADDNRDPAGAARALAAAGPRLIALEEVTPEALPAISGVLDAAYPHHAVRGTVGLWSKDPLREVRTVDLKPREIGEGWSRGLRAVATTPVGYVTVYVAHLPSVRASWPQGLRTGWRDESAGLLGAALRAEQGERVLLLGDLNASADDRGLDPVLAQMDDNGGGFGFSWPERFPVVRVDHVMVRGGTITDLDRLASTGSDHVPVAARLRF
ncbi:endonuclease/exonuclease/phosphatase family protein [Streptomyces sp. NBC_00237]|uniref:endonuclease/exonuclease/phosphatase family protein n=1 Tax=Streptomyces sp. NBC_00237 TaxID=2975687 RepID=UPI00225B1C22|nr:endonuclease/exonuclease/phosphatase family protein [Streptomyces sp. NBC_00237]MCX5204037.1 endonuclease/exonuclease/phosphatase family protein [Streptomyces sp. NBC_00237]